MSVATGNLGMEMTFMGTMVVESTPQVGIYLIELYIYIYTLYTHQLITGLHDVHVVD